MLPCSDGVLLLLGVHDLDWNQILDKKTLSLSLVMENGVMCVYHLFLLDEMGEERLACNPYNEHSRIFRFKGNSDFFAKVRKSSNCNYLVLFCFFVN